MHMHLIRLFNQHIYWAPTMYQMLFYELVVNKKISYLNELKFSWERQ